MTDPLRETFENEGVVPPPVDPGLASSTQAYGAPDSATDPIAPDATAPDSVAPDATAPDSVAPDSVTTDSVATGPVTDDSASSSTPGKPDSLTPLYAAAGLAEVVMTSLRARLAQAQAQAKASPAAKGRVAELQQQLRTYRDQVTSGYTSLANRGKPTVDSTLVTVRHLSGRAERKVDDLRDAAAGTPVDEPPAEQVPPVVVQPVVVVEPTDADRTPPAAS